MRKLLVAVDGSAASGRAVDHAIELARLDGHTKLLLLNVQQTLDHWYKGGLMNKEAQAYLRQAGQKALASAGAAVDAAALNHELHVEFGVPGDVIARLAREHDCACVVMGTRGLSDLAQVFMGSTAYKVVQLADRPVTLVK